MSNWRKLLSVQSMILCLWIVAFAIYQMQPFTDPDTPWHYATGLYILKHHSVPTMDVFSWSSLGQPWVTQEWLFEVVFAWLGLHLGFLGVWLLVSLLHALTVFALYRVGVEVSGGNRIVAAITACLGTLVGLIFWTMRPQVLSYTLFAVFLWILQRVRQGHFRVLWLVPALMLIWGNAHGSSSIGLLMLVLEVIISFIPSIGRFQRLRLPKGARIRLLGAAALGVIAGFFNPNFYKAYTYALLSANKLMVDNINEWHSPNFHSEVFKQGVLSFLVFTFLVLLVRSRKLPMRETLYFGGSFAMLLIYQRFTPYMAIAAAPLLAYCMSDWFRGLLKPGKLVMACNGIVTLGVLGYFGTQLPSVRGTMDAHFDSSSYPVAAVTYLQQHHLTKVLNAYHWGGYMIYRGVPTFVDGRTDVFLNNGVFSDYLAMKNIWSNAPYLIDEQYRINAVMFPGGDQIITYLTHTPGWSVAYQDGVAEILVRNPPKTTK